MSKTSSKIKLMHKKTGRGLSLKQFVKDLIASGDEDAKLWTENKTGAPQKKAKAERLKNKGAFLQVIRSATKNARRKQKAS